MSLLIQMQYAAIGYASRGTKIAFTCVRNGNLDICVMVGDGGNKKRLTDHPARDYEPSWSPDGTRIAFVSTRHKKHQHIFVIDSDGRNLMELTGGSEPAWSPDGTKIAFSSSPDGEMIVHIAVMDADGRNRVKLEDHRHGLRMGNGLHLCLCEMGRKKFT
jgi:Tol biopolymer transport system component